MTGHSPDRTKGLIPAADREEPLTRALVLSTALAIIDEEGADGLSMRRLGKALDRNPMTLYRYAANKAALLDGVVETRARTTGRRPVRSRLERAAARGCVRVSPPRARAPQRGSFAGHSAAVHPARIASSGTLRYLEAILELLIRAGFTPEDALHIYRAVFGFLNGHILNELQEIVENPEETDDLLRLGLHRLPLAEFPRLRSMATIMAHYDGRDELERGLAILLEGLATASPPTSVEG